MYLIVLSIKLFIYFFNNLFLLSIKKKKPIDVFNPHKNKIF